MIFTGMPNEIKKYCLTRPVQRGFSLAEILAALTIGAMVLVAVLTIYSRAESSAASLLDKLDSARLPNEVLQRIAEDLDRIVKPGQDTRIIIENKVETHGFQTARLTILNTFFDRKDEKQTFEQTVWQGTYDYEGDSGALVLYRSHKGIGLEDKLLDEQKESWETELFVPICAGATFFKVQTVSGGVLRDRWTVNSLPLNVVVTVSFAEPVKMPQGDLLVPENSRHTRTIPVDRTRKLKFVFVLKEQQGQQLLEQE